MPSRGGRAHRLRTSDDDGIDEADEHDAGVSTWERTVSIVPGRARCERVVHIATAAEDVDDFDNIIAHELAGREEGSGGRAFAKRSAPLATKVGVNRPKPLAKAVRHFIFSNNICTVFAICLFVFIAVVAFAQAMQMTALDHDVAAARAHGPTGPPPLPPRVPSPTSY